MRVVVRGSRVSRTPGAQLDVTKASTLCLFILVLLSDALAEPQSEVRSDVSIYNFNNKLLRYPDIHRNIVTFVHGGDIWTVPVDGGLARRVTSHPGLEVFPKFSPDGDWIAFTGQYDGDEQVYVIPAAGGEPERLTSYPAAGPLPARWGYDHQVVGWSPDGSGVLFRSYRDQFNIINSRLYLAQLDGTLPKALPMVYAGAGALSPDGLSILYSPRSRDFRTWKRYEGGWAQDLWIYNLENNESKNVTQHRRTDRNPMWTDAGLFFVSDRNNYLNLYSIDLHDASISQLTNFQSDVRWASADSSGNIVYELDGELQVYSVGAGTIRTISVIVPSDGVSARPRTASVSGDLEHFSISPDGQRVALVARGDVYSVPVENGVTRNLTQSSTSHDRLAVWSPDGTTLAFVSDRSGEEEVWLVDAGGQQAPRQVSSGHRTRIHGLLWAPDGEQLAIGNMHGDLFVLNINDGSMLLAGQMGAWYNQDFSWSPDSRYLAYSALNDTFLRQVRIWEADIDQSHVVTSQYFDSFAPVWDPAGKHLYYLSDRELSPQIGSREWNFAVNRETLVYALALNVDSGNPFALRNDEANKNIQENVNEAGVIVQIDLNNIKERVIRVPLKADNYVRLAVTDTQIVLLKSGPAYFGRSIDADSEVLTFSIVDRKLSTLVAGGGGDEQSIEEPEPVSAFQLSSDGKVVLVKRGGALSRYSLSDLAEKPAAVSTEHLQAEVLPKEE